MQKEYYMLKFKEENLSGKMKALIERVLEGNGGRISFKKEDDDENTYPSVITFYGKRDIYFIPITDAYLDTDGNIRIDGICEEDTDDFTGVYIEGQYFAEILYFIGHVLNWFDGPGEQHAIDSANSSIMALACQLAEKELVDKHNLLPGALMDKGGENYAERYRDEFNPLYDKYYSRIAGLAGFEYQQKLNQGKMKKEEIAPGMVFTFGNNSEIEYVVTGIYLDSAAMERINHRREGSNRHGCGYGRFEYPDTALVKKMDEKELSRYRTSDSACSLEAGIYRLEKDIADMDFKTLAGEGEIVSVSRIRCEENPCGSNYSLEITFEHFGYAGDTTATFYEDTKTECIHLFLSIFGKKNINQ